MYRCSQCGQDNQATYKFCLGCGASAPHGTREPEPTPHAWPGAAGGGGGGQQRCGACGTMNSPANAFCSSCAHKFERAVPGGMQAQAGQAGQAGQTFRDFAPRLAFALFTAHQHVTTRPDHHAHVAIIAGSILAVARTIQSRVAPTPAVMGDAGAIAIRDGAFAQDDPIVVAYGQVLEFCRQHAHDDAGLAASAADPELAGRAQALADALRMR